MTRLAPLSIPLLLGLAACLLSVSAYSRLLIEGNSEGMDYRVEQVADGFPIPWGMAFVSPQRLLITQRQGTVSLLDLSDGSHTSLAGTPEVWHRGQGGMLDVAVPADYQASGWIYFTYSKPQSGGAVTTLARARLGDNRLDSWQDLLISNSATGTSHHFGSRIAFDEQGYLYLSIGDRGERPNGQNHHNHAGSILRLLRDGSVPEDNPFVGQSPIEPAIWSYGHRNPQGLHYDPVHKRLWAIEHGPRGGDEINLIEPGENYGWAEVSHGQEYWGPFDVGDAKQKPGMRDPVKVYIPSIAPSSLVVYNGDAFPAWRGDLFAGALKLTHLNRITLDAEGAAVKEERLLERLDERMRSLVVSPEGWLYLGTDSGKILRIRPSAG